MFPIEDVIGPQRLFSARDNIDRLVRFPIESRDWARKIVTK